MNYYVWMGLKAFIGSIFAWDAIFTVRRYFDWGQVAFGFVHHEYGHTAMIFLWLGTMFLLSACCGGLGFVSEGYRMKGSVQ